MNEKICRLCLQTISENYQEIDEAVGNVLKLNLDVSKDTVTCIECRNNLQIFLNLKATCNDMIERALSLTDLKNDVSLDPTQIENMNNLKSVAELKDEVQCSFCTKSTKVESLISLHESKENIFLVDILEKYIPELNSSNIGEHLTCKTCLDRMQSVSNFLMKCLDVEESISKYTEIEGTDDKGQIELQGVQQFIFKSTLKFEDNSCHVTELKQEYDIIQEELTLNIKDEITYETEADNLEPHDIKTEDADIEPEQIYCRSSQDPFAEIKLDNEHKNPLDVTLYKCDTCTYETTHKNHLDDHIITHQDLLKCEMCAFETTRKTSLKKHKLVHKSPSGVIKHKCDTCTYVAKRKQHLIEHKLIHKDPSEITMFKCDKCMFKAKRKRNLISHMLTHKSPSEVTTFKCEICSYKTIYKSNLIHHKLNHKNPSEITVFKCEMCTFKTTHKKIIARHTSRHKNLSKVTKFKCETCPFETIHKYSLTKHMMIHKDPSEVAMYKCETCTFQTIYKGNLTDHKLIHKSPSEITMFKCEMCTFQSKLKRILKTHMLTHKNASEVKKLKCEVCTFETIYKCALKRHMSTHEGFQK